MTEQELRSSLEQLTAENTALKDALEQAKADYEARIQDGKLTAKMLRNMYIDETNRMEELSCLYLNAINSVTWKLGRPFRYVSRKMRSLMRRSRFLTKVGKGFKVLFRVGPFKALKAARKKIKIGSIHNYYAISNDQRKAEEAVVFNTPVTFSILVPLYNTPIRYLNDMIESVQQQTYPNWELCLADGSDDKHDEVGKRCLELAEKDKRIVYKKLEKNMGISGNTNACIEMSTGEYISLFDHDDILHPSALFETMKAVDEHNADLIYTDEATFEGNDISNIITFHHKPDFAIDNLRANNYICHFTSFSRKLLEKAGMFRHEYDGSQDHDMMLRLTENADKVFHVRKLLYFWRSHKASVASDINSKPYAIDAGKRAVHDSIVRTTGRECVVSSSRAFPTIYNIDYELIAEPLISIIIPNCDHVDDLKRCVTSIIVKSSYDNYEILIAENNSKEEETFEFYKELEKFSNIRVIRYDKPFNYSDINNTAVKEAKGEYLLLLNNDTEVITDDWMEQLLMYGQREDVAAVGAKLLYPDRTIQHAGIILGMGKDRVAGHEHYRIPYENVGYMGRLCYARNASAVTAACLLIRRSIYEEVGGFDPSFAVAYNDIDFCLKLREKGYLNVFTPMAELFHYESLSRGSDTDEKNRERFETEAAKFRERWKAVLEESDPYFNPNFSLDYADFRLK